LLLLRGTSSGVWPARLLLTTLLSALLTGTLVLLAALLLRPSTLLLTGTSTAATGTTGFRTVMRRRGTRMHVRPLLLATLLALLALFSRFARRRRGLGQPRCMRRRTRGLYLGRRRLRSLLDDRLLFFDRRGNHRRCRRRRRGDR